MPKLNDLSLLWSTLTEIDTNAIREQARTPVTVAVLGSDSAGVEALAAALLRDPFSGQEQAPTAALHTYPLPATAAILAEAAAADLVLIVLAPAPTGAGQEQEALAQLRATNPAQAALVVRLQAGAETAEQAAAPALWRRAIPVQVDLSAADPFAAEFLPALRRLFPDRQVALAHHLPALRPEIARRLINGISASNAGYAASTGLAEIIPVLNIPFNVADMVVLTKNQGILAYKLALALGKDVGVQEMVGELGGVLGSGFLWRELARRLVGFIPVWGLIPKVAVAYAGTYATGMAVYTWYAHGRKLTPARMRQLYKEAAIEGKARAKTLIPKKRPHLRLPFPRRKNQHPTVFD